VNPGEAIVDRAVGLVLGAAVGDALGAPFEFDVAGAYSARFPVPVSTGESEMIGGGAFDWEPGEFTDDTQMAVLLARSLMEQGQYDPDDVWRRWRTWASDAKDVGSTTRFALAHPDWREVRHPDIERTAGNGALMRTFPLAIATLGLDDAQARDIVLHQARLTHHHPDAAEGCWLAVAMMRTGLRDGDVRAGLATLEREVQHASPRFRAMLAPSWAPVGMDVGNGSVWGCLAQAVWALRSQPDVEAALTAVIDLGSDTDTVACVTGAIAGSFAGSRAIPARWSGLVHGRVTTEQGELHLRPSDLARMARELIHRPDGPSN
jgi:ADP-ribosyl-[dinitrogen reductase] hydrolase